jgi:hypothetical protein
MNKTIKLKPLTRMPSPTAKEKRWMQSVTSILASGEITFNPRHYSLTIDKDGWFTAKPRRKVK